MKRIVDYILTISKLDSGLLVMALVDSQPKPIAKHSVKIFEGEARAAGVDMRFVVEDLYCELGVDWASLDPTRLLQVLTKLITNAIKFTRFEPKRLIAVRISACAKQPERSPDGIKYFSLKSQMKTLGYKTIGVAVKTSFCNFKCAIQGEVFPRMKRHCSFPDSGKEVRGHIHYGGSGLGLSISTEMHGGAVGFASELKNGNTFCFYVKARRS